MSYRFVDSFQAGPGRSCSKAVYKLVWHTPLLSVQWINSWWWTEELSETCRVSWQNKFVKFVHLVGFITKKFVTMHGHMNVKFDMLPYVILSPIGFSSNWNIITEFPIFQRNAASKTLLAYAFIDVVHVIHHIQWKLLYLYHTLQTNQPAHQRHVRPSTVLMQFQNPLSETDTLPRFCVSCCLLLWILQCGDLPSKDSWRISAIFHCFIRQLWIRRLEETNLMWFWPCIVVNMWK